MWYDKAYEELEQQLVEGEISQLEFRQELRYLRQEIEECDKDRDHEFYNNY